MRIFRCAQCGQMVEMLEKTGCPVKCCGEPMVELVPGTTDAAVEKHVPVWETKDGKVTVCVGSVTHPMLEEHFIQWIALETDKGFQRKTLKPGDEPKAVFALPEGETVTATYAYCNLHSLWKG